MNYFTYLDSPIGPLLLTSNGAALTGLYMNVPARDTPRIVAGGREDPNAAPFPEAVRQLTQRRYGEYLTQLKDARYRDHVFAYVEKEDTPRPLTFQLDLLRAVGFAHTEVLHMNVCFAAFGAVKA